MTLISFERGPVRLALVLVDHQRTLHPGPLQHAAYVVHVEIITPRKLDLDLHATPFIFKSIFFSEFVKYSYFGIYFSDMTAQNIKILILAAGKGTRMKWAGPKALALLHGRPMIHHIVEEIKKITDEKPVVIVGHKAELVESELGESCDYVLQAEQLGTGHAVAAAKEKCKDAGEIIVLSSDQPFIKAESIKRAIEKHGASQAKITFLTTEVPDFEGWRKYFLTHGRILRKDSAVVGIREYKDATEEEKSIQEVNTGCCYIFDARWLWENISKINNDNIKQEYYLTSLFEIAAKNGEKIESIKIDNVEALGANSKEELEILEKLG